MQPSMFVFAEGVTASVPWAPRAGMLQHAHEKENKGDEAVSSCSDCQCPMTIFFPFPRTHRQTHNSCVTSRG